MADLADLGRMPAAWRYRAARRADLVVAEVGDRAAAWLSAQRATFRARLFVLDDERHRRAVNKGLI
jgi:hypothetical protein